MIRASGIDKVYQTPPVDGERSAVITVLERVDLEVGAGDFVAIMGASGAGKSTLLQILGCLDRPTKGHYELDGLDIAKLSDSELAALRNRSIGFVFQSSHFVDYLDVADNVALPSFYARELVRRRARARAMELLDSVGLGDRAMHLPSQLSGGERQRAALARAVFHAPRLLLADEPTGNLDEANAIRLADMLSGFNARGTTVLLVTHDARIAARACTCYRLERGALTPCPAH